MRYIGVILLMGLTKFSTIAQYWSGNEFGICAMAKALMSKNEFWTISKNIHTDIKNKESKFEEIINKKIKEYYIPGTELAIDETIALFKGRFAARQHIKSKPNSTGIKMYGVADQRGYLYGIWTYKGSDTKYNAKPMDVVLDYAKLFKPEDNHIFIVDSYYGSLKLAIKLQQLGYKFIMTCRSDRPVQLFKDYLQVGLKQKGTWRQAYNNKLQILATSFHDTKICHFLSNCFQNGLSDEHNKTRTYDVQQYNKYKGGLDVADSHATRNLSDHRQSRWTKKALIFHIKQIVVNSWIIYKIINKNTDISQRNFYRTFNTKYLFKI